MQATLRRCTASVPHLSRCISLNAGLSRPSRIRSHTSLQALRTSRSTLGSIRALSSTAQWGQEAAAAAAATSTPEAPRVPITEFQELANQGLVHPNVIKTITRDMGMSRMTDVQTATINEALAGVDLVGQAKTGTGKTLAFLMPIFQKIIALDPSLASPSYGRTSASDIRAIIISPTRELAEQITMEARRVARGTGVIVQAAVGGTQKGRMLQQTRREGCHILVATPGRLADLLGDPGSGIDAPGLSMFVLDEADRLLDQGFWQEVQNIRRMLPDPREANVQTLMFSATVPREVVSAVRETLRPGFRFIKCVRDDEEPTHARVPQNIVRVRAMQNYFPAVYELCLNEIQKRKEATDGAMPFKAIVYFNSTAMVELSSEVFRNLQRNHNSPLRETQIFHMHSKLTQQARTAASDRFRRAQSGILLSSDVTARGMDFPNVTHVIQVGVPNDGEQYIHRIGRTARAGKEGTGYLFIHPLEEHVARQRLGQLPLKPATDIKSADVDMTQAGQIPQRVATILTDLNEAHRNVDRGVLSDAFRSLLGVHQYVGNKQSLIDSMIALSRFGWGLEQPPALSSMLVQKLGLGRVHGLTTTDSHGGGGFGGQRGGYGGGRDGDFGGRGRGGGGFGGGRGGDAFDQAGLSNGQRQDRRSAPRGARW